MEQVKRSYKSPRREAQAKATRRAMLDAAYALFMRQGFAETSIREVAENAAVSEQTVYNAFGDKIGILLAIRTDFADLAAARAEADYLVMLETEPDPMERIRMVAQASRESWEGGAIELELMVFDREHRDPRLEDLAKRGLAEKLANTRAIAAVLFPDEIRRPGFSLDGIAEFATAMDSAATVTTLQALGWSMSQWEDWVVDFLVLFLDPDRGDEPGEGDR